MRARRKVVRILAERLAQKGDRFVILALLRLEKAKHVQCGKTGGVGAQNLAVEIFRLGQLAGTMGRHPLLKNCAQIHQ